MPTPSLASSLPALRPRNARAWGWLAAALATLAVLGLVVLHGWLLWRRIALQQIFEPEVALRWLAGFALLGGLGWLRRQGVPLLHGRRALVLWLLVAVLHLGISATGVEGSVMGLDAATLGQRWLALPLAGGLLLLPGLVLVFLLVLATATGVAVRARRFRTTFLLPARSAGFPVQLFSRPPPF